MKMKILFFPFLFSFITINAQSWDSVGTGIDGGVNTLGSVRTLMVYNGDLYSGGGFDFAGDNSAHSIAKWNGTVWSAMGNQNLFATGTLAVYNNELFLGGDFVDVVGNTDQYITRWNGTNFIYTGHLVEPCYALATYDNQIYAGGSGFISRWDGNTWSSFSSGISGGPIFTLAVYNGELYAGGGFTTAGGNSANRIAKWNGTTWSTVGTGFNQMVRTLTVHNGELYAGGRFTTADSNPANNIAKWDGTSWSALGMGIDSIIPYGGIFSLCSFNGELYAGGSFVTADGNPARNIAKWNGASWSGVGDGMDSIVYALCVYDSILYAGGDFSYAGGIPAARIARWNPLGVGSWESLDKKEAKVFPNPFSNTATIALNNDVNKATLTVYNTLGKKVRTITFSDRQIEIEKNELAEGVYYYQITSQQKIIAAGKIVIQ